MANCIICNFFKRAFLYQVLIITAALKLKDAFRYNRDFFMRIADFLSSINLPQTLINYLPKNKEYTYKGFLIGIIVFASISMLGVNFFKILSGISCLLLAFLYHNPILKIKEQLKGKIEYNWETFEQMLPELEFILYVCIAFAMFGNAFHGDVCPKDKDKDQDTPESPKEEREKEIPIKEKKAKGKPQNKKGKNKKKKD